MQHVQQPIDATVDDGQVGCVQNTGRAAPEMHGKLLAGKRGSLVAALTREQVAVALIADPYKMQLLRTIAIIVQEHDIPGL